VSGYARTWRVSTTVLMGTAEPETYDDEGLTCPTLSAVPKGTREHLRVTAPIGELEVRRICAGSQSTKKLDSWINQRGRT
jgi:hypothetical protein